MNGERMQLARNKLSDLTRGELSKNGRRAQKAPIKMVDMGLSAAQDQISPYREISTAAMRRSKQQREAADEERKEECRREEAQAKRRRLGVRRPTGQMMPSLGATTTPPTRYPNNRSDRAK